jgi:hypothetical protein
LIQGLATAAIVKVLFRMVPGATGNCWFVFETFILELATVKSQQVQQMVRIRGEQQRAKTTADAKADAEAAARGSQVVRRPIGRLSAMLTKCGLCVPIACWTSQWKSALVFGLKMILTYAAGLSGAVAGCYLAFYSVPSGGIYDTTTTTIDQVDSALDSDTVRATVLEGVFFFVFVFIFNRVHRSMPSGAVAFGASGSEHNDVNLLACVQFVATVSLYTISGSSLNVYVVWANSIYHHKPFYNVYYSFVGQFFGGVTAFVYCLITYHIPAISSQTSLQSADDPLLLFAKELESASEDADDDEAATETSPMIQTPRVQSRSQAQQMAPSAYSVQGSFKRI